VLLSVTEWQNFHAVQGRQKGNGGKPVRLSSAASARNALPRPDGGLASRLLDMQRKLGNRLAVELLNRREDADRALVTEPAGAEAGAAPPIPSSGSHKRYTELLGGVIGGAAAGAGLGFLVGGPVGAVVGGVVGLIAGAILGARLGRKRLTGPIADPMVQAAMRTAWTDSQAASAAARHEESGYIVRHPDGTLAVERWPRGAGASISPPARDAHGRYHGFEVLGEFHTHPNPPVDEHGRHWVPGPSPGDIT